MPNLQPGEGVGEKSPAEQEENTDALRAIEACRIDHQDSQATVETTAISSETPFDSNFHGLLGAGHLRDMILQRLENMQEERKIPDELLLQRLIVILKIDRYCIDRRLDINHIISQNKKINSMAKEITSLNLQGKDNECRTKSTRRAEIQNQLTEYTKGIFYELLNEGTPAYLLGVPKR